MLLSSRVDLQGYIKDARWRAETAGVTVPICGGDILVSTARGDDRDALHVTFSAIAAGLRADGACFNFADGVPRPVSNAEMSVAILAALGHVQACFDREGAVEAARIAGLVTTRQEVDEAFADVGAPWTPPGP